MNRIQLLIERAKEEKKKVTVTPEENEQASRILDVSDVEFAVLQSIRAKAFATGIFTTEEANTLYEYVGGTDPARLNNQPLEIKIFIIVFLSKLGDRI